MQFDSHLLLRDKNRGELQDKQLKRSPSQVAQFKLQATQFLFKVR